MEPITIRALEATDFAQWRAIRLRSLLEHPEAFGMPYEEEAGRPESESRARFEGSVGGAESAILGAFAGSTMVGCFGFWRPSRERMRHSVDMWGMYVAPEVRGRGAGRALLREAIRQAGALPGVQRIALGVMTTNKTAWRLYESEGFVTWGREPDALRLEDRCLEQAHLVLALRRHDGSDEA